MRIGLLNLEPKYKNLAIEKLRLFYSQQGDEVENYFALQPYDRVYCSSIFTFTPKHTVPKGAICGGSGFDLITTLPPEIEAVKPHLNFGFTTRGCFRDCPFCIVARKEGRKVIPVASLMDIWNGVSQSTIRLLDNNILGALYHFFGICEEAKAYGVTLDFNQGLDHRLLTHPIIQALKSISHIEYRFAFDSPAYYKSVEHAINLLQGGGINRSLWYVLVGFNTTFQEDLDRVNFLRERGQQAYIQRYTHHHNDFKYIALSQWVNQHHIFYGMTFEQFLDTEHSKKRDYHRLVKIEGGYPRAQ